MRVRAVTMAAVVVSTLLSGCMADPLPEPTVRNFLLAWQSERYRDAAEATTGSTRQVSDALQQVMRQLDARDLRMKIESIEADGDTARAAFLARLWLDGIGRQWTYEGHLRLRRFDGEWKIVWGPKVIHPKLDKGEELAVVTDTPARAPVLGARGRPLVQATPVVTVGVQPDALTKRQRTLTVLAGATGGDPGRMRELIDSAQPDSFVPLATLRRPAYSEIEAQIEALPGLRIQSGTLPLPPQPSFARALLGGVGAVGTDSAAGGPDAYEVEDPGARERIRLSGLQLAFRQRLSGTPGSKVVTLEGNGQRAAVLADFPGRESRPVRTTIDVGVQRAAEHALDGVERPAALVAVEPSTGKIRAVANRPSDSANNRAFTGHYSPGSAFKPIAAEALFGRGLAMSSPVPCPDKRLVNGATFTNPHDLVLPEVPSFGTDFAMSCDTAFVGLSRQLTEGALREAAGRFGLGGDWKLPVSAFTGAVPSSSEPAQRAATTVGQGGVMVSPLSMAMVAATIDSGAWRRPVLVTEPRQHSGNHATKPRPLPADHSQRLRELMRKAVETGSAEPADLPGEPVSGTTGTAKRDEGKPHAWFIGYRGDLAFTVFIDGGGSGSSAAAPVAADFLAGLSPADLRTPSTNKAKPKAAKATS